MKSIENEKIKTKKTLVIEKNRLRATTYDYYIPTYIIKKIGY